MGGFTRNSGIKTDYVGGFRSCGVRGVLERGETIKYETVCKEEGDVWVSYT
ncbi:SH3 domain-containing protein, partial [Staphylococcus epidermidis]|uniref:SH3 domain-containing protein n=1 Tax=Staphylococcus epidermidis TaxID=1282 RepID=UPI0021B3396B